MTEQTEVTWPPTPPIDAWGAFFEHMDREVAEGRETEASVKALVEQSTSADLSAAFRRASPETPKDWIRQLLTEMARVIVRQTIQELQSEAQNRKAPFWAKKWRGQQ